MLALLAALLLQETAADFLKKVEDKYAQAKSFQVTADATSTGQVRGKPVEGRMTGTLKSKGDGKIHVEFSGKLDTQEIPKTVAISDGSRLHCAVQGESKVQPHSLEMGRLSRVGFVRGGLFGTAGALVFWAHNPQQPLGKMFEVTKVADAGTEKVGDRECRILSFTLAANLEPLRTTACRIWVDPEKFVILKRELTNDTGKIVETYADPVFDGDIADESFAIPK